MSKRPPDHCPKMALGAHSFSIGRKRVRGRYVGHPALWVTSWEVHSNLIPWGLQRNLWHLNTGDETGTEKMGRAYSHQGLDLGRPSSSLQWCLRSQPVALPVCRDKLVTPSGQGTQYIVLPDFGPPKMSCASLWDCSTTPHRQANKFVALITTVASSST